MLKNMLTVLWGTFCLLCDPTAYICTINNTSSGTNTPAETAVSVVMMAGGPHATAAATGIFEPHHIAGFAQ